ncbi:MAG: hypothetical protein ACRYG8_50415 [Janthinobacterium lividum]
MSGAPALLPMLGLGQLRTQSETERQAVARSESGTVVHEVGHFLAAAKLGLPADFVMFDWASDIPRKHAVYMHERYGVEVRANRSGRLGLLAAGYAAELRVFGVGLLNRAVSDLEAAAGLLGFTAFELERDGVAVARQLNQHDPFGPDDAVFLVEMHNVLATLINAEGGPDDVSSFRTTESQNAFGGWCRSGAVSAPHERAEAPGTPIPPATAC